MSIDFVDPEGLPRIEAYRQVSIATGSRLVFVAGQVAWDAEGKTVGAGDLAAQVERCYLNAATALAAAGGSFEDVAKVTIYAVDWSPEMMPRLLDGIMRAAWRLGTTPAPPGTLVGVSALDVPEHLVELEVTAVLD